MRPHRSDRSLVMARETMIRALHKAMIERERMTIVADTFGHHPDAAALSEAAARVAVALDDAWTAVTDVQITPLGRGL
jgi:hypothetical protein